MDMNPNKNDENTELQQESGPEGLENVEILTMNGGASDNVSDVMIDDREGEGEEDEHEGYLSVDARSGLELDEEIDTGREMDISCGANGEGLNRQEACMLYLSHFLSMWNGRGYEFAAIIFTATAWPDTLVAASTRGVVRTLASICFSSSVGRWIDHAPDRLRTLLTTITANRIAVICASILWFFIVEPQTADGEVLIQKASTEVILLENHFKVVLFVLILGLGVLEGLSATGNVLSMERDWVVTAAAPDGHPYDLTQLNATMRRIDLICKLLAPILISIITSTTNIKVGVMVTGGMSAASWGMEIWCAKRVWLGNLKLQERKDIRDGNDRLNNPDRQSCPQTAVAFFRVLLEDFRSYFSTKVWIPSLSLSLLHLSALSYGATFVTFLLNAGFSLAVITFARTVGSIVEIGSTVVAPVGVKYLSKAHGHGLYDRLPTDGARGEVLFEGDGDIDESARITTGLERLGLWGLTWQLVNLIPVTLILWSLSTPSSIPLPSLLSRILSSSSSTILLPVLLFTTLSFSRLGLWIFDLTTQQLTQTLVAPTKRSSFAGCEYSLVAMFELGNYVMAIIWHRPEQFRWIAVVSLGAVVISVSLYAAWVRKVRGHLVHWERLTGRCKCVRD